MSIQDREESLDKEIRETGLSTLEADLNELALNELKDTIYQSNFIIKHFDFYQWLQKCVCRFIPHDVLIAGWGNFTNGNLQYDISSSISEIHAQQLSSGCNVIQPLMTTLFRKWEENGDKWFFNDEFSFAELGLSASDKIMKELSVMHSVLVYGFRDKRSDKDILYVFFNSRAHVETHTSVLSMIMPHLDEALRRIECLPQNNQAILKLPTMMSVISQRESSVLSLVVQGRTNIEIAESLFISINTVKNHLKNIFKKMDVSSRTEAVAKYLRSKEFQEDIVANNHNVHHLSVNSK
jgi:transcriptional regulator EpsA